MRQQVCCELTMFQVFPLHAMAMDDFDLQLEGYSDEVNLDYGGSEPNIYSALGSPDQKLVQSEGIQQCPSTLWSMEPGIFAMEMAMKGDEDTAVLI